MRALRKEPQHRYNSIEQFASDIRRYLSREPVQARQGNWVYYSQRFIRRHAFGVTAGAAFIVFIIAFAVAMSIQTQRIAAERDRVYQESETAKVVSAFMEEIFDKSQPLRNLGQTVTARDLLDEAGRRIRGDLNQRPEVRARLLEAVGRAYRRLDEYSTAVPYLEDSLRLRRQLPDPDGTRTATILIELAMAVRKADDLPRAERLLSEALKISKQHQTEHSETYAKLLLDLGKVHLVMGNMSEARTNLELSRDLFRELFGSLHPDVGAADSELAIVFMWQGNLPAAEQAARESVQAFRATHPPMHPDRVDSEVVLAQVLQSQGRFSEAAELFENSLAVWTKLYGANSAKAGDVLDSLAGIKKAQGMLAEAEQYARRALRAQEASVGKDHRLTAYERTMLAGILLQRGTYKEAEEQARLALATFQKALPPDHQYSASAEYLLGEALLATGQLKDAEAVLTASANRWKRNGAPPWRAARSESALGEVFYRLGRNDDAEKYMKRSYTALVLDEQADADAKVKAQQRIRQFYLDRGQRQQLEALMMSTSSSPTSVSADRTH
jgi:tetratricopeptide (TPR) repeat protein